MSDLRIVPYAPERHQGFVFDTFTRCLGGQFPWSCVPRRSLVDQLTLAIEEHGARTLVAEVAGVDDAFAGWVCTVPADNEVVFAYTRHPYRRKFGCLYTMLRHAGVDVRAPMPVRFWTRAAARIVTKRTNDGDYTFGGAYWRVNT